MIPVSALLLLLSLFLCSPSFSAESIHWEFAGWYGGGCYPNLEIDPTVRDRLYLTSDVAGIWKSDDAGEHWNFATKGLGNLNVPTLAIAPSDPNVLYAGTGGGVYVSHDAASTWVPAGCGGRSIRFERPQSHRVILISKKQASRAVVGAASGDVWVSDDFGSEWRVLGDRRPFGKRSAITALAWIGNEEGVYASSGQGLAKFSFNDGRWRFLGDSPKPITDILAHPKDGRIYAAGQKNIFMSEDGGTSWKAGGAVRRGVFFRLVIPDPERPAILAAWNDGWKGGVVLSEDDGVSWKALDRRMTPDVALDPTRVWAGVHGRINALKADPFDAKVLYRTDWWGVWKSEDGGATWKEKINGAPNTVTSDILVTSNGDVVVATMDNGLLRSSDGGKSYQTMFPKTEYEDDVNGHVWRVLENSRGELIATSSPWNRSFDQVILSRDGGKTFERTTRGLPPRRPKKDTVWQNGYARAIVADPGNPDIVYLGIDGKDGGGFFISSDGGRSWRRGSAQPASIKIYNGLSIDPGNTKRLLWGASGNVGGVYLSEDAGQSWKRVFWGMKKVFDVMISKKGWMYAAGDLDGPALFVSDDGGKQWALARHFGGKGAVEALCALPDGRVAVGVLRWNGVSGGEVHLASADGRAWQKINGDLPEGPGPAALVYHPREKALYMARFAGSVYKWKMDE